MSSRFYFDQISGDWDRMRSAFFSESVREAALDALDVQAGRDAADLGAGTGFVTEALLARGLRVIAVDQSAVMLAELMSKFRGRSVTCRQADAARLPLGDDSVDYTFANMYLHHVESPAEAIAEAARIVRPGGRLAITDLDEHAYTFLQREHNDRWLGFRHDDLHGWLEAAGLDEVAIDAIGSTCQASSATSDAQASIGIFLATATKPTIG